MTRRVLMLAFHFPPMKGSSGLQRTLNFVKDLPQLGWQPRVLTASARAYPTTSDEQMDAVSGVVVRRLPCLDAGRHLAISGAYPDFLARPDRWVSWLPSLVVAGLAECARWKPHAIWSTFPIPTAILAGGILSRLSGVPWVTDFRDSMTEENYPVDPGLRRILRRVELMAVRHSRAVVFTSAGTVRMYAARYPEVGRDRWVQIPNGYDEESFQAAERLPSLRKASASSRIVLLHSGLLDPVDRDPMPFLHAVSRLKRAGAVSSTDLRILLRASGHDSAYWKALDVLRIGDIVELAPSLPYLDALREMMDVDGLLVFQARNCNHQTPAKLYEYLRAGKPIFGLTDRAGDTADVMRAARCGQECVASIDDTIEIEERLSRFLRTLRGGGVRAPDPNFVRQCCRSAQSAALAGLLHRIAQEGSSRNLRGEG